MSVSTAPAARIEPLAVAGFVVSIVGVLLAHPLPVAGVLVGVVGVVLSTVGLRRGAVAGARGRLAVAGLVLGVVSIGAAVLNGVLAGTPVPPFLDGIG